MDREPAKSKILVATPTLVDPNFAQTVVLLCDHGAEGTLGLVLNRPTELRVSDAVEDLAVSAGGTKLYSGGPVGKNGVLVLCRTTTIEPGSRILDGVYLVNDAGALVDREALGPGGEIRCFAGYAGWGPGQLEAELGEDAWAILAGDPAIVFDEEPRTLWSRMMRRLGGPFRAYGYLPEDPSLN